MSSNRWQGPGWWLANDGRWYPPTAIPGPEDEDEHQHQPRKSQSGLIGLVAIIVVVVVIGVIGAAHSASSDSGGSSNSGYSAQSGVTAYSQALTLTLTSFTDPAKDSSGYTSDSGNSNDHFAVVGVSAINNGNSALPSSIPVTITAFGSDGQAYDRVTETTDGNTLCSFGSDSSLAPSETLTYCAGYVVPNNVTVNRIEVSGNQGYGSGTVSWDVNDTFGGWSN